MRRDIVIDPADLGYRCVLRIAGTECCVASNSRELAETLREWVGPDAQLGARSLSMQIVVRDGDGFSCRTPHFRGMKHLVFARFSDDDFFLFNIDRRQVTATVSAKTALDRAFWNRILLPIMMGVLGPAAGVLPVHAACISLDGVGALIAGASGAGKSTLSIALAQQGFDYISDDWTYLAGAPGRLAAYGMGVPAKLLPDAVGHFPFLSEYRLGIALNQELAYELPASDVGARLQPSCCPRCFFLLERSKSEGCEITPIRAAEARQYVESSVERLPLELESMIRTRSAIIERLAELSCWKLVYGGPPKVAAAALQEFFTKERQAVPA